MSLSQTQYQAILDSYDRIRHNNQMEHQRRKEEVHERIPEIREIDEKIAHISIEAAKYQLFHPDTDGRASLRAEIYELSMEKINLLAIHHYPTNYLDDIYTCPDCQDTGYIGTEKCHCFQHRIVDILFDQSNLRDLIKKETGSSFVDLLTKKRIETARELVLGSSMKMREIAERCGYSDQHYFSYCFKKYCNESPNAMRRRLDAGKAGEGA